LARRSQYAGQTSFNTERRGTSDTNRGVGSMRGEDSRKTDDNESLSDTLLPILSSDVTSVTFVLGLFLLTPIGILDLDVDGQALCCCPSQ